MNSRFKNISKYFDWAVSKISKFPQIFYVLDIFRFSFYFYSLFWFDMFLIFDRWFFDIGLFSLRNRTSTSWSWPWVISVTNSWSCRRLWWWIIFIGWWSTAFLVLKSYFFDICWQVTIVDRWHLLQRWRMVTNLHPYILPSLFYSFCWHNHNRSDLVDHIQSTRLPIFAFTLLLSSVLRRP